MNWEKVAEFLSSGQIFSPVYTENKGDCVQIYYKDGSTEFLDMQSNSFLSMLLYHFGTSISANRKRYGKLVGKKQLVPIVLTYGVTLVPFNARKSIGHQTKIGWFKAKEILRFSKKSDQETIVHLSKHKVPVLHSEKFCIEQLKNARCIDLCYGEIHEPYRKKWLFSAG